MRANLAEREELFGQLVPWDHANYGMGEPWARCHPYEQQAKAGDEVQFRLVATNHSTEPLEAACRAVLPRAWSLTQQGNSTDWARTTVPGKSDGEVQVRLSIPPAVPPGRYVLPVDLQYGDLCLQIL